MIQNPILKVLFTFKKHKVKCLLIGGQACIVYGAAEFSRDSDFVILCDDSNLKNLKKALDSLKAGLIYVPPLKKEYLDKGHACHFRCREKSVENLRIDIISKMKGCGLFEKLWKRRKKILLKVGGEIDVISLFDLVLSKKTQRDKDWRMLKRLVENDIILNNNPSVKKINWWFYECRSPDILIKLAKQYPAIAGKCAYRRPLLSLAISSDIKKLSLKLNEEEVIERNKDIEYWKPLRKELESLRHKNINAASSI